MKGTRFLRTVSESNAKLRFTVAVYHACLQSRSIFYQEVIAPASTHFSPKLESRGVRNGGRIIPMAIYFGIESAPRILGAMQEAIDGTKASIEFRKQKTVTGSFPERIRSDIVSLFVFISSERSPLQIIAFLRNQESNTNGLCYLFEQEKKTDG